MTEENRGRHAPSERYVLVPRVPTYEMENAACEAADNGKFSGEYLRAIWAAMLAASGPLEWAGDYYEGYAVGMTAGSKSASSEITPTPQPAAEGTPRTDAAYAEFIRWQEYCKKYGHLPEAMEQAPDDADPFHIARTLERELSKEREKWNYLYTQFQTAEAALSSQQRETQAAVRDAERYRDWLHGLLDIYEDRNKPSEEQAYIPGAFSNEMEAIRKELEIDAARTTKEPT